ncbi:hypothetical protein LCGC14_0790960 [marine sediment metagenome]|uniref:Uncharacterized protein n=1 Tax=marine sediment metagenome TaxID=412755 RepID=A0A0F9PWX2_9ZZZZ
MWPGGKQGYRRCLYGGFKVSDAEEGSMEMAREVIPGLHGEKGRKNYPHKGGKRKRKGLSKAKGFAVLRKMTSSGRARDGKLTW